MERGLIDADLGGNLYKQRVALPGRGKSGWQHAHHHCHAVCRGAVFSTGSRRTTGTTFRQRNWRCTILAHGFLDMTEGQIITALAEQVLTGGNTMSRMINEALETMRDLQQMGVVNEADPA